MKNLHMKTKKTLSKVTIYLMLIVAMILFAQVLVHSASAVTATPVLPDSYMISATLINQDPSPARAGDIVKLRFQIQNQGSQSLYNTTFQLVNDYPFTVVDAEPIKVLSYIGPYQIADNAAYVEFSVKIDKDIKRGTYPIKMKYSYGGVENVINFDVVVTTQEYAQIIYLDKARLSPGVETDMNFTINNVGNAPLQNMIFSWNEPTGAILPVYSDNTKYIRYLDAGQSIIVSYIVIADVNAKPGLYPINLDLKYQSLTNATQSVVSTKAGVFVGGSTDFDVAFSESTAGQTSLSVANTGNNPASSVAVKIPQQEGYTVSGSNAAIIGNLDKGDYTIVSFQIVSRVASNFTGQRNRTGLGAGQTGSQNGGQASGSGFNFSGRGNNNLQVVIEYTDTTGQRISVEKSVPIQFRSASGTGTGATGSFRQGGASTTTSTSFIGGTWFWIILLIIVAGGSYFIYKKKLNNAVNAAKKGK